MRSSFFGLNVAIRGLYTAQRNLDVVNHNLSNVNTPGYSRQQSVQRASNAIAMHDGSGMVGTGSEVVTVERIFDDYLNMKFRSENVSFGEWSVKSSILMEIEKTFNEPSMNGSGFNKIMDDFYTAMDDLSQNAGDISARKVLISRGIALTGYFNNTATHFEKLQSDLNENIRHKVDEINSLASQIQNLNKQIYTLEIDGNTANDLRDKRNVIVDKLSGIVNIDSYEMVAGVLPGGREDKHFVVTIGGSSLVDHFSVNKLKVLQRTEKLNEGEDIENLYRLQWEDGNAVAIRGGELKGYLDMRDGNVGENGSPNYKGIPYYIKKLNEFVRKFSMSINEGITESSDPSAGYIKEYSGHADGFGLKKPGTEINPTGIRFFTMKGVSSTTFRYTELDSSDFIGSASDISSIAQRYEGLTAKNFTISGDLLNKEFAEYNIAASSGSGLNDDNTNLLGLLEMRHNPHLFAEGAPEDYMVSLVATLGIDAEQSIQLTKNQQIITKQVDDRRVSVSGVSIDEEMANLVRYQHAYNAAAKMISTMAQVYDTLINRVGISGR